MKRVICVILCLSMISCLFACLPAETDVTHLSTVKSTVTTVESVGTSNSSTVLETSELSETNTSTTQNSTTTIKTTQTQKTTEPTVYQKTETTTKKERIPFDIDNLLDDGKIVRYKLRREDYYKFISNPSQAFLDKNGDEILVCSKSNTVFEVNYEYPQTKIKGEGFVRLGFDPPMPLYKSLIDFTDKSQELNNFLSEKGIKESACRTAIVYSSAYPITIWLQTDKTSYFLTIDHTVDDREYTYSFYTLKTFKEKYSPRTASLFLNGKVISKNVVLHYDYADVPFVAALKAIGAKVNWKSDTTADITINGKLYRLDTNKVSVLEKGREEIGGNSINIIMALSGGTRFAEKRNKELILDSVTASYGLYIMSGYRVEVDYQNKKVEIIKSK